MTDIPELKIGHCAADGLILLEQDSGGNIDRVALHRVHVRYLAEQFGLVAAGDLQTNRAIARLEQRLQLLRDRIDHLADYLALHSDHKHADLSYETTYARASADIAHALCDDLQPADSAFDLAPNEAESKPAQGSLL